jgi:hypothetical protein
MHSPRLLRLIVGLLLIGAPGYGAGQESRMTRELHPWGRFKEGAWKHCRVVTETLDEQGAVTNTSVTETKTTLKKVDAQGVTLLVEAVVEIAGRELTTLPKTVQQGFHGEMSGEKASVRKLGSSQVTVGERIFPCNVEEVESREAGNETITKVYFTATVAPFVLRRESVTTDSEGQTRLNETTLEVFSLRMPCKVLNRIRPTAHVKVVSKNPKGTTVTWAFTSVDVPGGVVCQTAKEYDENGRLVRQSTLAMIDYGLEPEKEHSGLFNRMRGRYRSLRTAPR